MPSVTYRKRGNKWHLRFRKTGEPERTMSFPGTISEAKISRIRDELYTDFVRGVDIFKKAAKPLPHSYLVKLYINANVKSGNWSPATKKTNGWRLDLYLASGKSPQGWIDSLQVSPESKKSYCATLNSFLSWCKQKGYSVPASKVELATGDRRRPKKIKYLTLEQLDIICDTLKNLHENRSKYAGSRNRLYMIEIWHFAFWQLLRRDEIIRIMPEHISPDLRFITIHGKGGQIDTIPIVEPAKNILRPWLAKGKNPLFGLKDSKNLWRAFNQCVKIAFPGSGFNLHSLRHGGIVHYLSEGINLNHVSKLARHKNIKITADTYGDVIPSSVENAFMNISVNQSA